MRRTSPIIPLLSALVLVGCAEEDRVAGNHASTGNAQAAGRIVSPDGAPARDVLVECIPDTTRPWDPRRPGWSVRTDSLGRFRCIDLPLGRVAIHADHPASGLGRWREDTLTGVLVERRPDTLARPGILHVALAPGSIGWLHLSGLSRKLSIRGEEEYTITDIPAGWTGSLRFSTDLDRSTDIESGLEVSAGGIDSAGYTRSSTAIRVPLPGGTTSTLTSLPVLIRLDSSWPGFATSQPDGSDLRLASSSGQSLPVIIAHWDRSNRSGAVWTRLDSLPAPGASVDLVVHWGLPIPSPITAPLFRTSDDFLSVWPLGDTTNRVLDRIGGAPGIPTALERIPGPIGPASRFNGSSAYVVFPRSPMGSVELDEGGPYTVTCWVRLGAFTSSRYIAGHGALGSALKFQASYGTDRNNWLAQDFHASPAGVRYAIGPADTAVWTHLAMTALGDSTILFINGVRQTYRSGFNNSEVPKRSVDFLIGASMDSTGKASQFFRGDIAEVWVQDVVRSNDWLRFVAANQAPQAPKARVIP